MGETNSGRVVIVVTDGNETRSTATLESAIHAAREAGVLVYVVAIESRQFNPAPLRRLARDTGGSYRGAGSSGQLRSVYAGIAAELRRTWRVEYLTSARGGDALKLDTSVPRLGAASARLTIPGEAGVAGSAPSRLLPETAYESFLGTQVVGALVGLLALAGTFVLTSVRGSRLKRRLAPHIGPTATKRKQERQRLQAAAGFSGQPSARLATGGTGSPSADCSNAATSRSAPWSSSISAAERAWPAGWWRILAQGTLMILAAMAGGAAVPWLVVYIKGGGPRRSRTSSPTCSSLSPRR